MTSRWRRTSKSLEISRLLASTVSLEGLLGQLLEVTVELTDCAGR